jgi:hypothetical protein
MGSETGSATEIDGERGWSAETRRLSQKRRLSAFRMPREAMVRLAIAKVVRRRSLFAMHMAEAIVLLDCCLDQEQRDLMTEVLS